MSPTDTLRIADNVRASFEPILRAVAGLRQELAGVASVVSIRPGYSIPARGKPRPAAIVAVTPGTPPGAVKTTRLAKQFGVRIIVVDATPDEQIAAMQKVTGAVPFAAAEAPSAFERWLSADDSAIPYAAPKIGSYEPLDPPALPLVEEKMEVTICVSPEAGWAELESFLAATKERLTIAMYQFTAPHIFKAVSDAVTPAGRTMSLVLHPAPEPPPKSGVKAQDMKEEDIISQLRSSMASRFAMSWATLISKARPEGLWASAYHIKVAVRDGATFWLSSGNWQSSNQPALHLFGETPDALPAGFQRKYNRDYHAIITNDKLAAAYETYIKRDYALTTTTGTAQPFALPDLFVPAGEAVEPISFAEPPQLFPPLRLKRKVRVQPLLTPDNYVENVLALIQSATKSVWFQNQYINFRNTGEDFAEFKLLISALKDAIDRGCDVRIICRDMMKQESMDILLALGFPRLLMRFQPACHNKTIIVDRKVAMLGSHNWSNEGIKTNRDASLIFYNTTIARYLAAIFKYDWERLATAKPMATQPRVAKVGEPAPQGFVRVPFSAVYDD